MVPFHMHIFIKLTLSEERLEPSEWRLEYNVYHFENDTRKHKGHWYSITMCLHGMSRSSTLGK